MEIQGVHFNIFSHRPLDGRSDRVKKNYNIWRKTTIFNDLM